MDALARAPEQKGEEAPGQLSGEKIQWYLASELRERIRASGIQIRIIDRQARKEFRVEPRQFSGRLLHQLPPVTTPLGDVYVEIYLCEQGEESVVGLYRNGTRVLPSIADLEAFARSPWTDGSLQGIVDVPSLNLAPATRTGVIHDAALAAFAEAIGPLEDHLTNLIDEQRRAQEEQATQDTLRSIQRAFREAMLVLPEEEYDCFEVGARRPGERGMGAPENGVELPEPERGTQPPRRFFEFAEGGASTIRSRRFRRFHAPDQPGQLWRSRYDADQNVIVVNSGHRDFVYTSRAKTLKLRYLVRL
jgi:hypothetical protein